MSWGKKITVLYLSFVLFMSYMVYQSVQQKDIYLVSKDYYKDEINYEATIQQMKNTASLSREVAIEQTATSVVFDFPDESVGSTGKIRFFRPSNATFDVSFPLNINENTNQEVNVSDLPKGLWVIKLSWQKAGIPYYLEQKITL